REAYVAADAVVAVGGHILRDERLCTGLCLSRELCTEGYVDILHGVHERAICTVDAGQSVRAQPDVCDDPSCRCEQRALSQRRWPLCLAGGDCFDLHDARSVDRSSDVELSVLVVERRMAPLLRVSLAALDRESQEHRSRGHRARNPGGAGFLLERWPRNK